MLRVSIICYTIVIVAITSIVFIGTGYCIVVRGSSGWWVILPIMMFLVLMNYWDSFIRFAFFDTKVLEMDKDEDEGNKDLEE